MSLQYFFDNIAMLRSELVIAVVFTAVVFVDLLASKKTALKLVPVISLVGIIAAAVYLLTGFYQTGGLDSVGLKDYLTVEPLTNYFKLLILFGSAFIVVFSMYSDEIQAISERHGEYYSLLLATLFGMLLMVSANDYIVLYISIELVSLTSYVLAGSMKTDPKSSEASLKYLLYGASASGIMLFGISILYGLVGSTSISDSYTYFSDITKFSITNFVVMFFILVGIGYKISSVPFHFWTPDVYEGSPTVITAMLSVTSKAAGFMVLIRFIVEVFRVDVTSNGFWTMLEQYRWEQIFTVLAIASMSIGNFAALRQKSVKRMLAYSSIAHIGYMLSAMAVLSDSGLLSILYYFFFYYLMNLGAFVAVVYVVNKTGSDSIESFNGIGYKMPLLGVALTIFLVSLTGLPPTAGFIGKFYIVMAMLEAKMIPLTIVFLLNSVVALYYYIRVVRHMFLMRSDDSKEYTLTVPENGILLLFSVPVVIFGIYFTPIVEFIKSTLK